MKFTLYQMYVYSIMQKHLILLYKILHKKETCKIVNKTYL